MSKEMQTSISQDQLKDIVKTALVEVLEERQDLLQEAIEVALEDTAFYHAIKEGENTDLVDRKEIFNILESKG